MGYLDKMANYEVFSKKILISIYNLIKSEIGEFTWNGIETEALESKVNYLSLERCTQCLLLLRVISKLDNTPAIDDESKFNKTKILHGLAYFILISIEDTYKGRISSFFCDKANSDLCTYLLMNLRLDSGDPRPSSIELSRMFVPLVEFLRNQLFEEGNPKKGYLSGTHFLAIKNMEYKENVKNLATVCIKELIKQCSALFLERLKKPYNDSSLHLITEVKNTKNSEHEKEPESMDTYFDVKRFIRMAASNYMKIEAITYEKCLKNLKAKKRAPQVLELLQIMDYADLAQVRNEYAQILGVLAYYQIQKISLEYIGIHTFYSDPENSKLCLQLQCALKKMEFEMPHVGTFIKSLGDAIEAHLKCKELIIPYTLAENLVNLVRDSELEAIVNAPVKLSNCHSDSDSCSSSYVPN